MPNNEWTNNNKRSIMFDILEKEDPIFQWPIKIPESVLNWEYDNSRISTKKKQLQYNVELATNKKRRTIFEEEDRIERLVERSVLKLNTRMNEHV